MVLSIQLEAWSWFFNKQEIFSLINKKAIMIAALAKWVLEMVFFFFG